MPSDISGPGGNFASVSGWSCHFSGWAASIIPTVVENTGFVEVGNRTSLPTAQIVVGSAKGTGQDSQTMVPSGITGSTPSMSTYQGAIVLTSYSGGTMGFNATVTTVSLGREHDGKQEYAVSFQSSGSLTGRF